MVSDTKVNYINSPINLCARGNRSFLCVISSEIGPDTHIYILFAAMEQIKALSYQEYIIFDHIFPAKAKLAVIKIIQLGVNTEPLVKFISESYAEFSLHGSRADIQVVKTLPEIQVKLGIVPDAGRAQIAERSFFRFFEPYPEITASVTAFDIVENISVAFYLHAVSQA